MASTKLFVGGLVACGMVAEVVGLTGAGGAAFASGFVPGLPARKMGVCIDAGISSASTAARRGTLGGLRAQQQQPGETSRRQALSLAIAAGVSFLGGGDAFAAGSIGPESVDGPSRAKMAIRATAPGLNRNKIKVSPEFGGGGPEVIDVPLNAKDLTKTYKVTESGTFYKVLKEGDPTGPKPKEGDTVRFQYIGQVCQVDKDGEYDCAPAEAAEVYPTLPQGIAQDSPQYDSSFARGRPYEGKIGKAQVSFGIEDALQDMTPGAIKMIFLVPELSIACPKGRVCVAEITIDERISFYIELLAVNGVTDSRVKAAPAAAPAATPPRIVRKRLFGSGPAQPAAAPATEAAPATAVPSVAPAASPAPATATAPAK